MKQKLVTELGNSDIIIFMVKMSKSTFYKTGKLFLQNDALSSFLTLRSLRK